MVAEIFEKMQKFVSKLQRFSNTNWWKRPKMTQLRRIISQQPLGLERQVSTFWKEDEQGYNISENERNSFFTQSPPPSRLNPTEFWQFVGGVYYSYVDLPCKIRLNLSFQSLETHTHIHTHIHTKLPVPCLLPQWRDGSKVQHSVCVLNYPTLLELAARPSPLINNTK